MSKQERKCRHCHTVIQAEADIIATSSAIKEGGDNMDIDANEKIIANDSQHLLSLSDEDADEGPDADDNTSLQATLESAKAYAFRQGR